MRTYYARREIEQNQKILPFETLAPAETPQIYPPRIKSPLPLHSHPRTFAPLLYHVTYPPILLALDLSPHSSSNNTRVEAPHDREYVFPYPQRARLYLALSKTFVLLTTSLPIS